MKSSNDPKLMITESNVGILFMCFHLGHNVANHRRGMKRSVVERPNVCALLGHFLEMMEIFDCFEILCFMYLCPIEIPAHLKIKPEIW